MHTIPIRTRRGWGHDVVAGDERSGIEDERIERRRPARALFGAVLGLVAFASCLAPPPPIVAPTPYGEVRARSAEKADHFASLLERLVPRVKEILPGTQDRDVDVWVQERLRVYRFTERSESVRGFTLLAGEFDAKRIHLTEDGQSSWYLAHELVHALIGEEWRALPGVLEEGLADVVAEALNPEFATHIRSHRLLNASAVTGGLLVDVAYSWPDRGRPIQRWERLRRTKRIQPTPNIDRETVDRVLSSSRARLHREFPELPEGLYGFAWLLVHRIVDRHGLDGLHELCVEAAQQGHEVIPVERLYAAAEIDPDQLDPAFLASCFGEYELRAAASMQPELFSEVGLEPLRSLRGEMHPTDVLRQVDPAFIAADGTELRFHFIRPVRNVVYELW